MTSTSISARKRIALSLLYSVWESDEPIPSSCCNVDQAAEISAKNEPILCVKFKRPAGFYNTALVSKQVSASWIYDPLGFSTALGELSVYFPELQFSIYYQLAHDPEDIRRSLLDKSTVADPDVLAANRPVSQLQVTYHFSQLLVKVSPGKFETPKMNSVLELNRHFTNDGAEQALTYYPVEPKTVLKHAAACFQSFQSTAYTLAEWPRSVPNKAVQEMLKITNGLEYLRPVEIITDWVSLSLQYKNATDENRKAELYSAICALLMSPTGKLNG